MPLYTDSNYYYSGGSSQLYSPYYPGSATTSATSSSIYNPYSSTYNRAIGGSYVVPISTARSPSYTSSHGLSSSRYQPKLTTITETSPLISAARHTTLMPLTRIQSPKYTSYSASTTVHTPKYIPPRPILINTADIDVSANRYRKRKEETLRQAQRGSDYTSPTSSIKRRNSAERRAEEEEKMRSEISPRQATEPIQEPTVEQHKNRSTIKRNRAVVRLSTIRSRSKERNKNRNEDSSSPEPEKKFKDLPIYQSAEDVPLKWREKLADDLAAIPSYPNKKSPGEVLREKYLIQNSQNEEDYASQCKAQRLAANLPKENVEQVIVELNPLHHTVRRLSIPQCPTFHDICEDISSDKIDDDLNAGELRRRASIIQCQEQELLNELQKSASGTFQMFTMERCGSHDSVDEIPHKIHSKRSSKKGKKIRTKITAIVDVENAPSLATIVQEKEEDFDPGKSPKPKFTVNVESIEEHHKIHKVFKLPKKKSIKKAGKIKEQNLPEGFMSSLPKPQTSPKKKFVKPTPEVFTFDEATIKQTEQDKTLQNIASTETGEQALGQNVAKKSLLQEDIAEEKQKSLRSSQSLDNGEKPALTKTFAKSNSINIELKTPTTPVKKIETPPLTPKVKTDTTKPLEKSNSIHIELKTPTSPKIPIKKDETQPLAPKNKTEQVKSLEKSNSINTDLNKPSSPTTPIKKNETQPLTPKIKSEITKPLEKSNSVNPEPKTPTTPKTSFGKEVKATAQKELTTNEDIKTSATTFKSSESVDGSSKSKINKFLEKTNSVAEEPKSPTATYKKEEDKKPLKTSQSLEVETKPKLSKILEKSNSINIELKTPTTPKTPLTETITEETPEPKVATPKPIKKSIMKSDSGEDFWAQIGSRETLYMNKRKKEIMQTQWQKREDLLESTNEEEVKNINEIKTLVTSQKIEALKRAEQDQKSSKGVVGRSNSNESVLKNKPQVKSNEEKEKKKSSPLIHKSSPTKTNEAAKTPVTPKDLKSCDAKMKTNDKLENSKMPVVAKMSKETSLSSPTSSPVTNTSSTTTTSNTTMSPKITGQQAKSPEQQEQAEQNKFFPTTPAKNNNNKNEIDINKTATTTTTTPKTNEKQQLAKTFTLPAESTKFTLSTSAISSVVEATTTKQPETKLISKTTEKGKETNNAVTKTKITDTDNKTLAAKKQQPADKKSPTKTKAKTSPNAINADQFIAKAPDKPNASPVEKQTKTTATISTMPTTSSNNAPTKKTPDKKKTTTMTSTSQTNAAASTATTTTSIIATKTDDNQQICNKIKENKNSANTNTNNKSNADDETKNNNNDNSSLTCGGNLSKFATVSNLAQCLRDVDADLDDYLPSSAEISENEDYKTDDSDFDYSSIDGWENLTPSMKKKVKQRRRKEKQAEQARFDPQKKVKIDTTRKLYVKDEAPRYPLVATPRPLWKREKIVYPDEDSDDESDESEESGSTEETEDSDECTTSEEYDDEINPSSSGGGVKSGSGGVEGSSDPNKENSSIIRMSTCSNDSGFEGGTAPSSPKKMLETSYTYSQFQKSGRFTPPATIIPRFKNYTVDDFHFLAVLGKGSFGKVLLAELRDTTYYYAVKCLKKDVVLEDDDVDSTLIERKVLALGTKHPYLCHLFCTFQTESHLFFVMEYLNGGDLMFHIQESGRFTEERARFYGAEIVSGLKFLHKKGIIYRDLKLDNVLLDYEGHVRIADFGMCKLQIYLDKTADSFCGTPDYMAPEIIKGDKYNQNVDWWSFGVLLYEMLIGQSPFSGCDEDELFWSICNELPWFPVYITAEATSILKGLLEKDYTKRIGSQYSPAGDIVEHIFFRPIDWNLLEKRQIEPPFRPQVKHPLDTQYFDRVFTRERVRLTPIDKDILQSMDQKQFLGFTYTNPHITLD